MSANTYLPPSPVAPPFLLISSITNDMFAEVTVTTDNAYVVGQLIHFNVPASYGMTQIDQKTAKILSVDVTNLIFITDINTTQFDVFTPPVSTSEEQPATLTSAGSKNLYNTSYVPFHSINGQIGN